MPAQVLLSPKQAAEYLGMKPSTVRRYIREGKINALHINGRVIRIPHTEIERLLKETE